MTDELPSNIIPERIRRLRGKTFSNKDFLTISQRDFYQGTLTSPNRIAVNLPLSQHIYTGEWRTQSGEPTCAMWTIVNAMKVLGRDIDDACLQEMLDYSLGVGRSGETGLSLAIASSILAKHPQSGITLRKIDNWEDVSSSRSNLSDKAAIKDYMNALTVNNHAPRVMYNLSLDDRVVHNSFAVKRIIDSGGVILSGIRTEVYTNNEDVGTHAVCVAGYRVNENGTFDIQLVDSLKGVFWTSIELLSEACLPSHTYQMEIKDQTSTIP